MCGIAGIFRTTTPVTADDVSAVQRMLRAQRHRGPDGEGLVTLGVTTRDSQSALVYGQDYSSLSLSPQVILGHRRLAIVDLSEAACQPMANEDETIWVTYNGEIYNFVELRTALQRCGHQFRSHTDSEVLLHGYEEWGIEGLLQRLRGMFAFALYDGRATSTEWSEDVPGQLFLARDRLGIKPLYYWQSGVDGTILFSSEVKALCRSGIVPNEREQNALLGFLLLGSVPAPFTIVKKAQSLLPGHYLRVTRRGVWLRQYWELPRGEEAQNDQASEQAVEELSSTLACTISQHLVSDVPLGVFLSGGLDSGGLVALAHTKRLRALRTLTVAFDEPEWDESRRARDLADFFHTDHTEVRLRAEDFWAALPTVFAAIDQPTNDGVNSYFVAGAARKIGLTVALSGLGGDEVFWGYRHYQWLTRRHSPLPFLARFPEAVRKWISQGACLYGSWRGEERWQRFAYLHTDAGPSAYYLLARGFFAPVQIDRLLGIQPADREAFTSGVLNSLANEQARTLNIHAFNRIEMRRYLHDQLLRDSDVFGMAHSIEVRVPYLDHLLVEQIARIPVAQKLRRRKSKPLLLNCVYDPLVANLSGTSKRGFSLPMDQWMRQYANELEKIALQVDCLDLDHVRLLWRNFRNRRLHWSRAWALVVLGACG
jgi:asparagine synthase (glutamine-hydrolysing)